MKYGAAALAAFILLLVAGSLLATSVEHYALQASQYAVQAWHYVWATYRRCLLAVRAESALQAWVDHKRTPPGSE